MKTLSSILRAIPPWKYALAVVPSLFILMVTSDLADYSVSKFKGQEKPSSQQQREVASSNEADVKEDNTDAEVKVEVTEKDQSSGSDAVSDASEQNTASESQSTTDNSGSKEQEIDKAVTTESEVKSDESIPQTSDQASESEGESVPEKQITDTEIKVEVTEKDQSSGSDAVSDASEQNTGSESQSTTDNSGSKEQEIDKAVTTESEVKTDKGTAQIKDQASESEGESVPEKQITDAEIKVEVTEDSQISETESNSNSGDSSILIDTQGQSTTDISGSEEQEIDKTVTTESEVKTDKGTAQKNDQASESEGESVTEKENIDTEIKVEVTENDQSSDSDTVSDTSEQASPSQKENVAGNPLLSDGESKELKIENKDDLDSIITGLKASLEDMNGLRNKIERGLDDESSDLNAIKDLKNVDYVELKELLSEYTAKIESIENLLDSEDGLSFLSEEEKKDLVSKIDELKSALNNSVPEGIMATLSESLESSLIAKAKDEKITIDELNLNLCRQKREISDLSTTLKILQKEHAKVLAEVKKKEEEEKKEEDDDEKNEEEDDDDEKAQLERLNDNLELFTFAILNQNQTAQKQSFFNAPAMPGLTSQSNPMGLDMNFLLMSKWLSQNNAFGPGTNIHYAPVYHQERINYDGGIPSSMLPYLNNRLPNGVGPGFPFGRGNGMQNTIPAY